MLKLLSFQKLKETGLLADLLGSEWPQFATPNDLPSQG